VLVRRWGGKGGGGEGGIGGVTRRGRTRNDHVGREGAGAGCAAWVIVDLQSEETHVAECC
jgi:hypothetical protein